MNQKPSSGDVTLGKAGKTANGRKKGRTIGKGIVTVERERPNERRKEERKQEIEWVDGTRERKIDRGKMERNMT